MLLDINVDFIQSSAIKFIDELCGYLENNVQVLVKPSFFFMKIFICECLDYSLICKQS